MPGKKPLFWSLGVLLGLTGLGAACTRMRSEPEPAETRVTGALSTTAHRNFFEGDARSAAFRELERLRAIQKRHWPALRQLPRVIGMGVGLDREHARLDFVVSVSPGPGPLPTFASVEGVPVELIVTGEPELTNGGSGCEPCHADLQTLPVQMGNSGHSEAVAVPGGCNGSACTIGFKACDLGSEDIVFLTASHCVTATNSICAGLAGFGAPVYHRSSQDVNSCTPENDIGGVEWEAPPSCTAVNTVDATSVESDASLTQISVRDIGSPSAYPGTALPGDAVQKSGRTTGLTTGTVTAVAYAFSITAPEYCCSGATDFDDQIWVAPDPAFSEFAKGGDSGSALLDQGTPPAVLGLIFAGTADGTAYANTIDNLSYELDLSMNLLDCMEPCSATLAARRLPAPRPSLHAIAEFRDDVLSKTERGRAYVDTYYRFTGTLVTMMVERPLLFARTVSLLEDVLPILERVTNGEDVTVPRARIRDVSQLFTDYANATSDPALRRALLGIRSDLNSPQILQEFGVTAVGS